MGHLCIFFFFYILPSLFWLGKEFYFCYLTVNWVLKLSFPAAQISFNLQSLLIRGEKLSGYLRQSLRGFYFLLFTFLLIIWESHIMCLHGAHLPVFPCLLSVHHDLPTSKKTSSFYIDCIITEI